MMKWFRYTGVVVVLSGIVALASCESDNWLDPIPYVLVDTTINLSNQEYHALQLDRGHVEIQGGWKGIIIYRENATTYKAFEKASPHRTDEVCAEVFVDPDGLFMKEGCDNSIYDFNGNPIGGYAQIPLRQYNTQLNGYYLRIFNMP